MPTPQLLPTADDLFRAKGLLQAASDYLKREKFPARSLESFQYEAEALALYSYEPLLVPGLLQTPGYARALIGDQTPALEEDVAEARIKARLGRQELLYRKPRVALSFVLYEAALHCPIGDPEVRGEQLLHLIDLARKQVMDLQVLPYDRAIPAALGGPMVLLETRSHDRFALTEGQELSQFTSDPDAIIELTMRHGKIRQEALCIEDSRRFIERMVDE